MNAPEFAKRSLLQMLFGNIKIRGSIQKYCIEIQIAIKSKNNKTCKWGTLEVTDHTALEGISIDIVGCYYSL